MEETKMDYESMLEQLVMENAATRFPEGLNPLQRQRIERELMAYAANGWARRTLDAYAGAQRLEAEGHRWLLVGTMVGSFVAYCLGLTHRDPMAAHIDVTRFAELALSRLEECDTLFECIDFNDFPLTDFLLQDRQEFIFSWTEDYLTDLETLGAYTPRR